MFKEVEHLNGSPGFVTLSFIREESKDCRQRASSRQRRQQLLLGEVVP
jgi:hypothetical protein